MPEFEYPSEGGDGSGGAVLPSIAYGEIAGGWARYGSIGLVGTSLQSQRMAGISNFGVETYFPSPGNPLTDASVLASEPRVRRTNEPGSPACGIGNEIIRGHPVRAPDGFHVAWRLGELLSGTSADGFFAAGVLTSIALTDIVGLPSSFLVAVSPTLATPSTDLHLVLVADDGTVTPLLVPNGRIDGLLIVDFYARPNLAGPCNYAQIRAYNAETGLVVGNHIVQNAALIPQGWMSPFAISNRGTLTSRFTHGPVEYGAGLRGPTP